MGSDDLFKKKRKDRKQRRFEYRHPRANSFLIVTEGECTEPLYFTGMQKLIQEKMGGRVDIVEAPVIDIHGEGRATRKLIDVAEQIVKRAKIFYQNIWVVFDRDDFDDFDQAVREGTERGYQIAWSNQSFEYWLYLHFHYSDAALYRDEWNRKLNEIFAQYQLGDGKYRKNDENIYQLVNRFDGVATAIRHARRRMAEYDGEHCPPSAYDPGTTVYLLAEELKNIWTNKQKAFGSEKGCRKLFCAQWYENLMWRLPAAHPPAADRYCQETAGAGDSGLFCGTQNRYQTKDQDPSEASSRCIFHRKNSS